MTGYAFQRFPALYLDSVEPSLSPPSFSIPIPVLIAIGLIPLIGRALLLLNAILLALIPIDPPSCPKGKTQRLIQPVGPPGGHPMKPGREDQSPDDIADVVHLRDEQHVHHEDQAQEGHSCHPVKFEKEKFEEDCSERPCVSRVEEVPRVVVGDCEAEESWAAPDQIIGVWEFGNIKKDQSSRQEEAAEAGEPAHIFDLGQPGQGGGYQMSPKMAIHRSIMTCPVPMKACPAVFSMLLFPSQAAEVGSRTSWRLAVRVADWQASQMQRGSGLGRRNRQRRKAVSRRTRMDPRKAMCSSREEEGCERGCLCYKFIDQTKGRDWRGYISLWKKGHFRGMR